MHAPLFTAPVLLIEQPRHLYSSEGHYEVLGESGHSLAYVNEHMTAWSHRGGSHRPHRFSVYGTDGRPLLTLDKPWDRGRPYIHVTGPHGEPYGTIVQDRSFLGSRFRLNDPRGRTIAEIRGDWNGWDFNVLDHAGTEIARIGKEHPGLTGRFFTTEDRYALEFAYNLPWPLRRLVLGAAITIDVLLHEREPEFYHSHYADFRSYPEYGYRPRHHWHHPRRGYIATRRVRPPLVARETFRPVRRRGDGPVRERRERVAEPRSGQRAHSSRSGASRSASRPARRTGGGFASRSEVPSSGGAARRERRSREAGGGRSGGGSTARSSGLFGDAPSRDRSSSRGGGASRSGGTSRSEGTRAGGGTRRTSAKRSGGASRSSRGFRGTGGSRSTGRSARRSGGGRSGGRSRRR